MSAPSELCPALDAREACSDWSAVFTPWTDIIKPTADANVLRLIVQSLAEAANVAFAPIAGETQP